MQHPIINPDLVLDEITGYQLALIAAAAIAFERCEPKRLAAIAFDQSLDAKIESVPNYDRTEAASAVLDLFGGIGQWLRIDDHAQGMIAFIQGESSLECHNPEDIEKAIHTLKYLAYRIAPSPPLGGLQVAIGSEETPPTH